MHAAEKLDEPEPYLQTLDHLFYLLDSYHGRVCFIVHVYRGRSEEVEVRMQLLSHWMS